jgi:hypothetical protein
MKKLLIGLTLFTSLMARASIDEAGMKAMEPKAGEVESARSCFQELETLGCQHPKEDLQHFKACFENVSSSLTPACKKRIGGLYRRK